MAGGLPTFFIFSKNQLLKSASLTVSLCLSFSLNLPSTPPFFYFKKFFLLSLLFLFSWLLLILICSSFSTFLRYNLNN